MWRGQWPGLLKCTQGWGPQAGVTGEEPTSLKGKTVNRDVVQAPVAPLLPGLADRGPLLKLDTDCQRKDRPRKQGRPQGQEPPGTQPCASPWAGLWDGWGSLLVTAGGSASPSPSCCG